MKKIQWKVLEVDNCQRGCFHVLLVKILLRVAGQIDICKSVCHLKLDCNLKGLRTVQFYASPHSLPYQIFYVVIFAQI